MMNSKLVKLERLLTVNGGIVTTQMLSDGGFSTRNIKQMVEEGLLERVKLGYYKQKQHEVSDTVLAAKLIPSGVLCLFTAIDHYELATVNPTEICIALPRDFNCPKLPPNLFVKIHHMTTSHFETGISEVEIDGAMVKIYNVEKTVCDCFKYENEVERSIALEVLKNYMARGGYNIQKLLEYAKLLGKKKLIYPYVEALL